MSPLLDRETIERAVSLAGDGPILIALSGGGDSTALLHLMVEALGAAQVGACVIDHALRPDSAKEARRAASFAKALHVHADVVTLTWPEPGARAQEEARDARYRALCATARKRRAQVIAVGHTRDDQAETVYLRANAGSAWRGLAGMRPLAPVPAWPGGRGFTLVRPLLGARRTALREVLEERRAQWIEDPSNSNEAFARVRARARLAELQKKGKLDPMRLAALAERLRPAAERVDRDAAALIEHAAEFEDGFIRLRRSAWRGGTEARRRALAALLTAAAGGAGVARGVDDLEGRLCDESFTGATLAGARIRARKDLIRIERDKGAVVGRAGGGQPLPPLALKEGEEAIWDGRLSLKTREAGWSVGHDDKGAPVLFKGETRVPLGDATAFAEARWLMAERVQHLLLPGERPKAPAFTG